MDGYLVWLNARLYEMKRMLRSHGFYLRFIVTGTPATTSRSRWTRFFGYESLINEIVWYYTGAAAKKDRFARKHDVLLWYSRSNKWKFNVDAVRTEYAPATKERFSHYIGNVRQGGDFGGPTVESKRANTQMMFLRFNCSAFCTRAYWLPYSKSLRGCLNASSRPPPTKGRRLPTSSAAAARPPRLHNGWDAAGLHATSPALPWPLPPSGLNSRQ